jgi:excisionase family DNA binding protein
MDGVKAPHIDQVLTVKEAVAYLRVGKTVLYPLLKEKGFRKIGGQYRLRKADLDALMAPGYDAPAGAPSEQEGACLTKEVERRTGGSLSREFDRLLGLTTTKPQRRSKAA